jgi:signal transduction histidine kinase
VRSEVNQRERLQELTQELERVNLKLETVNLQLAEMNEKLKKMDQLKSEFVSMAGHQLRGPMTVIKGYISLILDGTIKGANPAIHEALSRAMFSTEQLIKLIADLLDLSRIEAGKIKYEMTEGDLSKIMKEVLDKFKAIADKKSVALVLKDRTGGQARMVFDQDKIREAVVNYTDNAVKYSPQGGRVVVGLDIVGAGAGARMRVSVRDNGIGIRPEDIQKLFVKFSRTVEAQRHDPNGLGIGLFFAKRVVEDHGGTAGVESEGIGHGSTFWFEIPVNR